MIGLCFPLEQGTFKSDNEHFDLCHKTIARVTEKVKIDMRFVENNTIGITFTTVTSQHTMNGRKQVGRGWEPLWVTRKV